ncbi:MAG: ATP-dependent helicase [Actinomycetales bacterium]|nr:ATP-dependent helicase [Actinomycetales bacterium]
MSDIGVDNQEPLDPLLAKLDPEQRAAATSLLGPTCIIAGAGTGKTRTITHRIAYGISHGFYSANRVLALTYTNKAAAELRTRLRALGVGTVAARTFHAAALSQLEYFWPQFTGVRPPQVLDGKGRLLARLAEERKIKVDAAALRDLAAEIEWRKYSMLSLEQYAELKRKPPAGLSPTRMLELLAAYEDAKVAANQIDWEDVLLLTLGMLKSEPLALAHVQQQYRFFTVDEYQDISPLQHALLDVWLGDRSDLCVVGDPNQTIYSFTGATSSFLQTFESRYENATVLELVRNYRSSGQIVELANRLRSDKAPMGSGGLSPLQAQSGSGTAPRLQGFANAAEESSYIAHQVASLLQAGTKPRQIAILYRVNGQSEGIEAALASAKVPYELKGGVRFFQRPEIQAAVRAIGAEIAAKTDTPTHKAVERIARELGWSLRQPTDANTAAAEKWGSLNALLQILEEMPEDISLDDFYRELQERARSQHEPESAAVTLSTIHAAKGQEWDNVFIVGVNEGYLPISYAKTDAQVAEENRLFYVGVTRAKKQLMISWNGATSRFINLLRPANSQ